MFIREQVKVYQRLKRLVSFLDRWEWRRWSPHFRQSNLQAWQAVSYHVSLRLFRVFQHPFKFLNSFVCKVFRKSIHIFLQHTSTFIEFITQSRQICHTVNLECESGALPFVRENDEETSIGDVRTLLSPSFPVKWSIKLYKSFLINYKNCMAHVRRNILLVSHNGPMNRRRA